MAALGTGGGRKLAGTAAPSPSTRDPVHLSRLPACASGVCGPRGREIDGVRRSATASELTDDDPHARRRSSVFAGILHHCGRTTSRTSSGGHPPPPPPLSCRPRGRAPRLG